MSLLTGLLPVEQGVACLAALQAAVTGPRPMVTPGRRVRSWPTPWSPAHRPSHRRRRRGRGRDPAPARCADRPRRPDRRRDPRLGGAAAGLARELIVNTQARAWWRRLFTRPTAPVGRVVDLDHRRRRFTGWLAELIRWRDWTCRDPFCDAPIRHLDHLHRHHDGGPTTPANGRGVCERGNYVRELPGWSVRLADPDTHTVITTTPTGHQYRSNPPEPP